MIDFLDLFTQFYNNVDPDSEPTLSPTGAEIQALFLGGQLTVPFEVELLAQGLDGGSFKAITEVTQIIPSFFSIENTQGFLNSIQISFAPSGASFQRIFEIFPSLGADLSFTLADYNGFTTTKGNIFAYIQSLLGSQDPSKSIQIDFPGGSIETAFALPVFGDEGMSVTGQIFDLGANEDRDFFSFLLPQGGLSVDLSTDGSLVAGGVSLTLYAKGSVEGEVNPVRSGFLPVGGGQFQASDLAAGEYYLELDADEGANLLYSLQLLPTTQLPEQPPLVLDASNAQLLYVAYYGRPGDFPAENEGIDFWKNVLENAGPGFAYSPKAGDTLTDAERPIYDRIVDDFGLGIEYLALFSGKDNAQKMDAIYQYCFGRNAEPDPLVEGNKNYWVDRLDKEWISLPQAAMEVALGAQGPDRSFLANRVASANVFLQQLDTNEERAAYAGDPAGEVARGWLQSFGTTVATVEDADLVIAQIVAGAAPVV